MYDYYDNGNYNDNDDNNAELTQVSSYAQLGLL